MSKYKGLLTEDWVMIELNHKKKCKHCRKFNTYKIPTVYIKEIAYVKIVKTILEFLESAVKK